MNREPEQYSNKFNESKSEEQTRLADEALRRAQGDFPAVGGASTPQSAVVKDRASAILVNDTSTNPYISNTGCGGLSWDNGDRFSGPGGLNGDAAAGAAVGSVGGSRVNPVPDTFHPVSSPPLCTTSASGKHMNGSDIFGSK